MLLGAAGPLEAERSTAAPPDADASKAGDGGGGRRGSAKVAPTPQPTPARLPACPQWASYSAMLQSVGRIFPLCLGEKQHEESLAGFAAEAKQRRQPVILSDGGGAPTAV